MCVDYKLLKLKRDDAISEVKRCLKCYSNLKLFPISFEDRVKSYNSFLITINQNDTPSFAEADLKLLKELSKEEEEQEFVRKWDFLLSYLCEGTNDYIIRIFLQNEKITAIKDETTNVYHQLKNGYEILACLDENINYTIEDYSQIRNYELQQLKKDNSRFDIKKLVIKYINDAFKGFLKEDVVEAIKKLPQEEKKALVKYIQEDTNPTSYEYRKIKRGILLFAYYFDYIEFSYDELEEAMKRTGAGWKKIMPAQSSKI